MIATTHHGTYCPSCRVALDPPAPPATVEVSCGQCGFVPGLHRDLERLYSRLTTRAQAMLSAGRPIAAGRLACRATALEPMRSAAHVLLARARLCRGDLAGALAAARRARTAGDLPPGPSDGLDAWIAALEVRRADIAAAADQARRFNEALEIAQQGQTAPAIDALLRLLSEIDGGDALEPSGHPARAGARFIETARIAARTRVLLARLCGARGDLVAARRHLRPLVTRPAPQAPAALGPLVGLAWAMDARLVVSPRYWWQRLLKLGRAAV